MISDPENHCSMSPGSLISHSGRWGDDCTATMASTDPVPIYIYTFCLHGIKTKPCRDLLPVVILAMADQSIVEFISQKSGVV